MQTSRFTRRRHIAAATLIAALAGASLTAHAGHHGGGHGGHGGYGMFGEKMVSQLDLTADQRTLLEAGRQERQKAMQEGKALHQSLRALVLSDQYDEAAVAGLADQMAAHMRSQLIAQSRHFNELYRSLDQDQRAKLAEMQQKRAEHWQKYRQRDD